MIMDSCSIILHIAICRTPTSSLDVTATSVAMSPDVRRSAARTALLAYTVVALALIAGFGWLGWRRHRSGDEAPPHDEPTAGDRTRFLGYATALLAGLSFVAVVYVALAVAVIGSCR